MNDINVLGMDIAKSIFHFVGINAHGKTVYKKYCRRAQVLEVLSNLSVTTIALESCGGSHYWYRELNKLGHDVKLIAAQYVKGFNLGGRQKNDYNDARNIAQAASCADTPTVPAKNEEQQYIQSLLRHRDSSVKERTKVSNQLRALLLEYGETIDRGHAAARRALQTYLEPESTAISGQVKQLLQRLQMKLDFIKEDIDYYEKELKALEANNEKAQRIKKVPGVGLLTTMAIIANLGQPQCFKNGRHYAAYLGLVPRQFSSGGKPVLGRISKQGDDYIRQLLIHGARSIVSSSHKRDDKLSIKLQNMLLRMPFNKVCVALANRNARVLWSMLANRQEYKGLVSKL